VNTPQLPLRLARAPRAGLDDFLPANAPALAQIRDWLAGAPGNLLLRGPAGSGKSHLLLAALETRRTAGADAGYLPLAALGTAAAGMVDAQPPASLVAVDDLDEALIDATLQQALFALHNRVGDHGGRLLYASRGSPADWNDLLPDLRSRLGQSVQALLQPLDEPQRRVWFAQRAAALGMQLDEAALEYLFRRVGRDLPGLQRLLDRLDRDSLAAQRRLTVPFLRDFLAADETV
jgi:DnaA family protein